MPASPLLAQREGWGRGTSLRWKCRDENVAARVSLAWWRPDLGLRVTRPSLLITGFPRLQCPNWVLQLLLPDLPTLVPLCQTAACAFSRTPRLGLWFPCSETNLPQGRGHNRFKLWEIPCGAPGRFRADEGNQLGGCGCRPGERRVVVTRGGRCIPRPG